MSEYYSVVREGEYLEHHGVKGMKWGVRRWQNADGSLTPDGRQHYNVSAKRNSTTSKVAAGAALSSNVLPSLQQHWRRLPHQQRWR